jgi:hypothetical protein
MYKLLIRFNKQVGAARARRKMDASVNIDGNRI